MADRSQLTRADYAWAALRLRILHTQLDTALRRARESAHRDMHEVRPGLWIHNRYVSLAECVADLPRP